jgi:hypothetical protein
MPAASGLVWRQTYLGYLLSYGKALPLDACREGIPAGKPTIASGAMPTALRGHV